MGLFTKARRRNQSLENDGDDPAAPGWLKMLQDNSWELEILISGGAIFSLFQLSDLMIDFFYQLSYTQDFTGQRVLFMASMLAIKGLTLGFFLHVLLRSFWVSLVSLSAMFKQDKGVEPIKLSKPFANIEHSNLPRLIILLDKLSAWMMYNTFTIVFIIAGWLLLFFSILGIVIYVQQITGLTIWYPFAGILGLYVLDLFLFSGIRKTPYLSYIVYPFFKVFDYISLRFVYQKGFDFVSQHIARWKVALYYGSFILVTCMFTYLSIYRKLHWPNMFDNRGYRFSLTESEQHYSEFLYRNKTSDGRSHQASIQSDIISDPVLSLFINYSIRYDPFIDKIENPDQRFFENIWQISVDDSVYQHLEFYTIHGNNSTTMGITTYIDVGNFDQGLHTLHLINIYEPNPKGRLKMLDIPFWLDKEADQ